MRWMIASLSAVVLVWVCDVSGVNHNNVLYFDPWVQRVALPILALGTAALAWMRYLRATRAADTGGKWYVIRKTDPLRWAIWGGIQSLLFAALLVVLSRYALGVSMHYINRQPLTVVALFNGFHHPSPRTTRNCREYAILSLEGGRTSTVCTRTFYGDHQMPGLSHPLKSGERVVLHGRTSRLGAVVDWVEGPR